MPLVRQSAVLLPLSLGLVAGCQSVTEPSAQLILTITGVAAQAPQALAIEYDLVNVGDRAVVVSRCGEDIRPDVAVILRDGSRDAWSGYACPAIYEMSAVTILPGASLHRSVVVGQRPAATYRVTLPYRAAGESDARRLTAPRVFTWP